MSKEINLKIALLNDYYGNLLTKYQSDVVKMYYDQDLSLAEISKICNVSRQAIKDVLKRTEKKLEEYEEKLGLVARVANIKAKIQSYILESDEDTAAKLNKLLEEVEKI
ncbi:MAG TPA: sigma factor-like helix-turn-helix DNA-binding protein [Clostridia bacterium]|jgi:hypothetical protein|nr:sigma factor-like helix-turn-helix DNA-binding protein [Clostridia bacterium]